MSESGAESQTDSDTNPTDQDDLSNKKWMTASEIAAECIFSKEKLMSVYTLNHDKIKAMNYSEFTAYSELLNKFIKTVPEIEVELNQLFDDKDNESLLKRLTHLKDMLMILLDNTTEQKCTEVIDAILVVGTVKEVTRETIELKLADFISALTTLSLDIQVSEHKEAPAPQASQFTKKPVDPGTKTILAVDDVALMLGTLKTILVEAGYVFKGITSANTALNFILDNTPDLFILDIYMPEMDGFELASKIRARGIKTPIIFLTGNAERRYIHKAIEVGGDDFIAKPIDKRVVLTKIQKYIGFV
jgi:CheY-like chemotaxis protein